MTQEFIPVVDTDKIGYDTLAGQNSILLKAIQDAMDHGATAATIEKWLRQKNPASTLIDLATGAAYYIEAGRHTAIQAMCRCGHKLGTNSRKCGRCWADVHGDER